LSRQRGRNGERETETERGKRGRLQAKARPEGNGSGKLNGSGGDPEGHAKTGNREQKQGAELTLFHRISFSNSSYKQKKQQTLFAVRSHFL
jgi:hypothetical protein